MAGGGQDRGGDEENHEEVGDDQAQELVGDELEEDAVARGEEPGGEGDELEVSGEGADLAVELAGGWGGPGVGDEGGALEDAAVALADDARAAGTCRRG